MADVPYSPIPSVAPEDRPIPSQQINAAPAAFGMATAEATQHLGAVADHVGNELFERANAMQQLKQKADSDAAMTQYMTENAQLFADYKSQSGKNAVEHLPGFLAAQTAIRERIAGTLTSPFAIQAFQQESRSMEGRTTMAAAAHAGEENKTYTLGSAHDRADAAANFSLQHPGDEGAYHDAIQTNQHVGQLTAGLMGRDKDYADNHTLELNSNTTTKRISGMLTQDPLKADKTLQDSVAKGLITGPAADVLRRQVDSAIQNKVTTETAAQIYNAPANKDMSPKDLEALAEKKSEQLRPGDAVFKDILTSKVQQLYGKQESINRATQFELTNTLQGAVYGVGMPDGKVPTSFAELPAKAQAAYINSDDKTKGMINNRLSANAIHGDYMATPESIAEYHRLRGILTDPEALPADRQKALEMDMSNLKMPNANAQTLLGLREKLFNSTMKDNFLPKAMSLMQPILNDPTVGLSKRRNPDEYNTFMGKFGEVLTDMASELKRPPNDKEIKALGSSLLQSVTGPKTFLGMQYGTGDVPAYTVEPTEAFKNNVLKIHERNNIPAPTDEHMRQLFIATEQRKLTNNYTNLFGKTQKRVGDGSGQ